MRKAIFNARSKDAKEGPFKPLSQINAKKPWTSEEDEKLRKLINIHSTSNWTKISELMPERTGKQCRERWHNHLNPGIKKGDWTAEEDKIIVSMQRAIGNQWAKITKYLPGRTDNAVKNRFHATVRAKSRGGGNVHAFPSHLMATTFIDEDEEDPAAAFAKLAKVDDFLDDDEEDEDDDEEEGLEDSAPPTAAEISIVSINGSAVTSSAQQPVVTAAIYQPTSFVHFNSFPSQQQQQQQQFQPVQSLYIEETGAASGAAAQGGGDIDECDEQQIAHCDLAIQDIDADELLEALPVSPLLSPLPSNQIMCMSPLSTTSFNLDEDFLDEWMGMENEHAEEQGEEPDSCISACSQWFQQQQGQHQEIVQAMNPVEFYHFQQYQLQQQQQQQTQQQQFSGCFSQRFNW